MDGPSHPPPPWRLRGRAILIPARVRATRPPRGTPLMRLGRHTLGGLLLASYGPGSTLVYHELLGVGGVLRCRPIPAAWITHAHVDDFASREGGRTIWGIPKEDARFHWHETAGAPAVTVSVQGREIVSVTTSARGRCVRAPVAAPFVGRDARSLAWALGWLRAAPVPVRVRVPPDSPLASLAAVFSGTALVGDVALRVGAPRATGPR